MIAEPPIVVLLGLPFHDLTLEEALQDCREMLHRSGNHYLVTANVDFTAQANRDADLRKIVFFADRVVCDGMPLVWLSKIFGHPLRERVAGSDMVPRLLEICAKDHLPVYFFGSDINTLQQAGEIAAQRYPGLVIAGCDAPPMGAVVQWDNEAICARMAASGAKLLLVCLGCPKQERWIFAHHQDTGIPLSIGVGASLDFITGKQVRAPRWMQKTGLEWFWRMAGDPKRLIARYTHDFFFLAAASLRQARLQSKRGKVTDAAAQAIWAPGPQPLRKVVRVKWEGALEKGSYDGAPIPMKLDGTVLLDGSAVTFMDSGGLGRMAAMVRACRNAEEDLYVVAPSTFMKHALTSAHMDSLVVIVPDEDAAMTKMAARPTTKSVVAGGGVVRVSFSYPLDALHLTDVNVVLDKAEPGATRALVLDLAQVDFIDSRAVGSLIRVHKRMVAKGGGLYLANARPAVREIITLLRLDQILAEWKEGA
jgi:N-acetylglucosaminyldiphosphoundecaprenol N-acetyl-beta-D-mannosaminyltransferase